MKKQLVALAVGAAFCGLAQADGGSVTISGILDIGPMYANKAPNPLPGNPTNTGHVFALQDGALEPSIYSLAGSDQISNDLKAGFTLTGGFNVGTGHNNSPGLPVNQGQLFGEEAKATLTGSWGQFGVGLQLDPAFVAAIGTEPRGMTLSFSNADYWIIATAFNGPTGIGGALAGQPTGQALQGGIFDANSLSYSISANGFTVGLLYGIGGVAGATSASSQYSIGASYAAEGAAKGLLVSAGYVASKANTGVQGTGTYYDGDSSKIWFVGAGYAWGAFAVRAQYNQFQSQFCSTGVGFCGTAGSNIKSAGIGGDWTSGANKVNLSFYDAKDDGEGLGSGGVVTVPGGAKTIAYALLDQYSLSKRTILFGQIAGVKVDSQTLGAGGSGPGLSGAIGGIYTPVGLTAVSGETTVFFQLGMELHF